LQRLNKQFVLFVDGKFLLIETFSQPFFLLKFLRKILSNGIEKQKKKKTLIKNNKMQKNT
ncbi:hypothetical protein, partial [Metamycoplasma hyosynoviae]|uniref:hypothetical protein n=1 Tax=Metamycoplasma hyosynoviae TaxID=29559 RepID=UPI002365E76E